MTNPATEQPAADMTEEVMRELLETCPAAERIRMGKTRGTSDLRAIIEAVRSVNQSAAFDAMIDVLNALGWHSANGRDVCWCHAKSDVDHTQLCRDARAALAQGC